MLTKGGDLLTLVTSCHFVTSVESQCYFGDGLTFHLVHHEFDIVCFSAVPQHLPDGLSWSLGLTFMFQQQ